MSPLKKWKNLLMNKKKIFILAVLLILLTGFSEDVKRETRAVWLTTNFRLDWPPPTFNQQEQVNSLIDIFNDIQKKNLNTIYFQVRSNGTTIYSSFLEPFSPYFTGRVNYKPFYDPAKLAITEAHKRGLEIHAWINVIRCFAGEDSSIFNYSGHIKNIKPEWVKPFFEGNKVSYWLDPGIPDVRNYLVNVILEVALNYDFDGIHLDFIRYPGKGFDDNETYMQFGNEIPKDIWRRENISDIFAQVKKRLSKDKPLMKLGAAPIGIYKNSPEFYGFEAFNDVYQDVETWVNRGIIDYVVPQIYWNIKEEPKFDRLAKNWKTITTGRNLILGIAAYKTDVFGEIDEMIDISRNINTDGVAFFRYTNIRNKNFSRFNKIAFPVKPAWMKDVYPKPPLNLVADLIEAENGLKLKWDIPDYTVLEEKAAYFSVYSLPSRNSEFDSNSILRILDAATDNLKLKLNFPKQSSYFFAVKSLNRIWNESKESTEIIEFKHPDISEIIERNKKPDKPVLFKKNDTSYLLINLKQNDKVSVSLKKGNITKKIFSELLQFGVNIIPIKIKLVDIEFIEIYFDKQKISNTLKLK